MCWTADAFRSLHRAWSALRGERRTDWVAATLALLAAAAVTSSLATALEPIKIRTAMTRAAGAAALLLAFITLTEDNTSPSTRRDKGVEQTPQVQSTPPPGDRQAQPAPPAASLLQTNPGNRATTEDQQRRSPPEPCSQPRG